EMGHRVAEELGPWLGDPPAGVVLEPRTALAWERSELVADETAARVAALAAWRSGRAGILVASVQALLHPPLPPCRPGGGALPVCSGSCARALPKHRSAPEACPAEPRVLRRGARLHL